MDELKQVLQYQYKGLPEALQKAVGSEDWKNTLKTITWKHNLSSDDHENLNVETMLVLFGLESYKDFKQNLSDQGFVLPQEKINAIANEIDSSIFKPIRTSLDEVDRMEEENKPVMTDGGEVLSRGQVLQEIENPIKTPMAYEKISNTNTSNIIDDKLNKVIKLPRQEEHSESESPVSGQNKYSMDPYREPLE